MDTDIDFEKLQSNWEMFEGLCKRLSDDNLNNLLGVMAVYKQVIQLIAFSYVH